MNGEPKRGGVEPAVLPLSRPRAARLTTRPSRLTDTAGVIAYLPPREREVVGSIPVRVIPKTLKLAF